MDPRSYEIVYNSDLMIADRGELTTLALFYDRVTLPATSPSTVDRVVEVARYSTRTWVSAYDFDRIADWMAPVNSFVSSDEIVGWDNDNQTLFAEGVLRRLNNVDPKQRHMQFGTSEEFDIGPAVTAILRHAPLRVDVNQRELIYVREDQLLHLLREDITAPAVFLCAKPFTPREVLKAMAAHEIFRYLLPAANGLEIDQILQVREKIKDTREGFTMHLQQLSAQIESRLAGGEREEEVRRYAAAVVETTLIPDYREFTRQLASERSGFWRQVLDVASNVFEIDVPPWTPKFYGQLAKAIGITALTASDQRKAQLTNRAQAYQFMQRIESIRK